VQTAALNAVTAALRKEMLNKTQPAFLRVTAGALAALVNDPQLKLKGQADLHQLGQELLKQLDHRLSELEVRRRYRKALAADSRLIRMPWPLP